MRVLLSDRGGEAHLGAQVLQGGGERMVLVASAQGADVLAQDADLLVYARRMGRGRVPLFAHGL